MKRILGLSLRAFMDWRKIAAPLALVSLFCLSGSQVGAESAYTSALLMHQNNSVFRAANDRMTSNFLYQESNWCSTSPCGNQGGCGTVCGSSYGRSATHSVWGNYVTRSTEVESVPLLQGVFNGFPGLDIYGGNKAKISSDGLQIGLDLVSTRCAQFGVMFGYEEQQSKLSTQRLDISPFVGITPAGIGLGNRINADDYYFGFYGAKRFNNGFDLRGSVAYGTQSYDMARSLGVDVAGFRTAVPLLFNSFDGNTVEVNLELGRRVYASRCLSFRPVIGFDFFHNQIDASTDSVLGNFNLLNYGKMKYTQALLRVGSDMQWKLGRLNLSAGAYYSYDMADDDYDVDVSVAPFPALGAFNLQGCDLGNSIVSLNAGAQYYLNASRTLSVYSNYYADIYTDRDGTPASHTGAFGLQWKF